MINDLEVITSLGDIERNGRSRLPDGRRTNEGSICMPSYLRIHIENLFYQVDIYTVMLQLSALPNPAMSMAPLSASTLMGPMVCHMKAVLLRPWMRMDKNASGLFEGR